MNRTTEDQNALEKVSTGISLDEQQKKFTVEPPQGFSKRELIDGENRIILIENPKGESVQITVSPYDEGQNISPERIKRDVPDMEIKSPHDILVGGEGKGISFVSNNEAFNGNSIEVWFVAGNYLYQVSSDLELKPIVDDIIRTWQF